MLNWYSHCGEQYGGSLTTKYRTPTYAQHSHSCKYPGKAIVQKDTHSRVLAPLLTVGTQKQPKCPSTEERTQVMWYMRAMGVTRP